MKYYIVEKLTVGIDEQNNEYLKHTTIGYVTSLSDKQYIEQNWEDDYHQFIYDNNQALVMGEINITKYIKDKESDKQYSYIVDIELSNIDGQHLEEININNL